MGRFTRMLDDAINRIVMDFEARIGRRIGFSEYREMRDIRQTYKARLNQLGPTEGSEMFEGAKQSIVDEGIAKIKKFFDDIVNPPREERGPVVISNPDGQIVMGEPAPTPNPPPRGWGLPVELYPRGGGAVDTTLPIRPPVSRGPIGRGPRVGGEVDTTLPIRAPSRPTVPQVPQVNRGPEVPMFPETRPRL